jgi:hypothetical protein
VTIAEQVDWRLALADPVHFAEAVLGISLHPGQKNWLRESISHENLLVTGNRWGKSFICAVKALHRAVFRLRDIKYDTSRKYRIVTASITQDQANIVFDRAVRLLRESELLHPFILTLTRSPYPRLVLSNGAVLEARSTQNRGEYLLGNDYDYFIFDEVAFESDPDYVVEEVIKMRLADREGMLDLVSTPNGRNWFYLRAREIIERKRPGYFQSGDTRDNKFISESAVRARIESFSDRRVQQNIMGKFVDSGGEILKGEYVDRALENAKRIGQGADSTRYFVSGWDLARKRTATVGVTVSVENGHAHVVCLERFRMFDWNVVIEKIRQRQEEYPGELVVDATGLGDVVVEQLRDYRPTAVIFSPSTKAELLTNVELYHARNLLSYHRWELPDGPGRIWSLEDELRKAQWDDNSECDALMALALALWPLRKRKMIAPLPRVGRV